MQIFWAKERIRRGLGAWGLHCWVYIAFGRCETYNEWAKELYGSSTMRKCRNFGQRREQKM